MKYKLTANTKIIFGITLHQIQAEVSFGCIVKGDFGGWIEGDKNLSQDGNAWVVFTPPYYPNVFFLNGLCLRKNTNWLYV